MRKSPLLICSPSRSAFLPHSAEWKHCGFHTIGSSDRREGLKVGISSDMYLFGNGVMIPTAIMKKPITWKCPHWRFVTTVSCIHCSLWQSVLWDCCYMITIRSSVFLLFSLYCEPKYMWPLEITPSYVAFDGYIFPKLVVPNFRCTELQCICIWWLLDTCMPERLLLDTKS